MPAAVVVSGFLDSGRVRTSIDQFLSGQSHRRLSGTGVALTVSQPGNLEARVMYARKLGNAVSASDTDRSGRFWLQASKAF